MIEKCKTAIAEHSQRSVRQPRNWWQRWGVWFGVGVAIVLLIWWLRR